MKRGPYKSRDGEYLLARDLRELGYGYNYISKQTGVNTRTIRRWVMDIDSNRSLATRLGMGKDKITTLKSKASVRRRLIWERGNACEECGIGEWLGQPIKLELHNHRNLGKAKLLCPNCHSQTPDWRKKHAYLDHAGRVTSLRN